MAQKKKISYVSYMRNKRELDALYALGYRYDMEQDPEKKAALEAEIIKRCDKLKPKLGLKDISDEEARSLLGVSAGTKTLGADTEESSAENAGAAENDGLAENNGATEVDNVGETEGVSEAEDASKNSD